MAVLMRSILLEADKIDPPGPGRLDLVLAGFLAVAGLSDIPEGVAMWEPASSSVAILTAVVLVWRRVRPLAVVAFTFGLHFLVDVLAGLSEVRAELPFGQLLIMAVATYALARWAPWRSVTIGVGVAVALELGGEALAAVSDWVEVFDRALFWGFGVTIGLVARYRAASIRYRAEQVRSQERERIARELHDLIAHHVSAIAIQAEGAATVATSEPNRASDALVRIQRTAAQALLDMRQIVAMLRDPSDAGRLAPQGGFDELRALAGSGPEGLDVVVSIEGHVDGLPAGVSAAVVRIAQEAVTNTRRHAGEPSRVAITVARNGDVLLLDVVDDGGRVGGLGRPGYGLVGMTERAAMLGGTLEAGPRAGGTGWQVKATIPVSSTVP